MSSVMRYLKAFLGLEMNTAMQLPSILSLHETKMKRVLLLFEFAFLVCIPKLWVPVRFHQFSIPRQSTTISTMRFSLLATPLHVDHHGISSAIISYLWTIVAVQLPVISSGYSYRAVWLLLFLQCLSLNSSVLLFSATWVSFNNLSWPWSLICLANPFKSVSYLRQLSIFASVFGEYATTSFIHLSDHSSCGLTTLITTWPPRLASTRRLSPLSSRYSFQVCATCDVLFDLGVLFFSLDRAPSFCQSSVLIDVLEPVLAAISIVSIASKVQSLLLPSVEASICATINQLQSHTDLHDCNWPPDWESHLDEPYQVRTYILLMIAVPTGRRCYWDPDGSKLSYQATFETRSSPRCQCTSTKQLFWTDWMSSGWSWACAFSSTSFWFKSIIVKCLRYAVADFVVEYTLEIQKLLRSVPVVRKRTSRLSAWKKKWTVSFV